MTGTRVLLAASLAAAVGSLSACGVARAPSGPVPARPDTAPPTVTREMRGLWIATVANIDWPSRPGLPAEQQRAELVDLLDRAQRAGINAVFFHVRPNADAVYRSELEPWASMLTGAQGTDPGYDPLELAVREGHARGLQVHAWINPYRAGSARDTAQLAPNHVWRQRPELVRNYAGALWMDPGEPETLERTMRASLDIVRRYDVDGIHADDYFYPYPVNDSAGNRIDFPDSASFARHGAGMSRADWRRANVDRFVERWAREVHALKPWVQVGISPFGIWRPGNPPGIAGLDAYDVLYADARKWMQEGWLDYVAPQLYWPIDPPAQSFPALLDWWVAQNARGRHVWPGLAVYRETGLQGRSTPFGAGEIRRQINLTRERPGATGHLLYNTTATLRRNEGAMAALLADELYRSPAIPPASPWLDRTPGNPGAPTLEFAASALRIVPAAGEAARWWVVRSRGDGGWTTRVQLADDRTVSLMGGVSRVMVQAVDAAGNLSDVVEWRR